MDALTVALALGVRVTALFALTAVALLLLRRASAATRHLVAVAGLAGALALPLLTTALPQLELAVLPKTPAFVEKVGLGPGEKLIAPGTVNLATQADFEPLPGPRIVERAKQGLTLFAVIWVAAAWAAVALLLVSRLAAGLVRLTRIERAATGEVGWSAEVARCSDRLGLRRFVRLLRSPLVQVPMTAGVVDPVVILPDSSTSWTPERRRLVLLHELAHVKRLDWLSLLVSEIAAALWWFHPLAWVALRAARIEAEKATDDLVLRTGEKPSVYAGHLVEIVRAMRGQPLAAAMPMARASDLEARLRALLDRRSHTPASRSGRLFAVSLFASAVMLAVVRPTAAAAAVEEPAVVAEASAEEDCDHSQAEMAEAPRATPAKVATPRPTPRPFPVVALKDRLARLEDKLTGLKDRMVLAKNDWKRHHEDAYGRGMDLHRHGHYREAIEAFQQAIDEGQREEAATYNIACGYARLGDHDRAFEWLRRAAGTGFNLAGTLESDDDLNSLRSDPRFSQLKSELRRIRGRGESDRATAKLDRLKERNPSSPDPWYQAGKDLLRAGEYDLSARAFQEAASRSTRPGGSLYNTACAYSLKGDKRAALDFLEKAIDAGFDDPGLMDRDDDLDNIREESRFAELREMADELRSPGINQSNFFGWKNADNENEWKDAAHRFEAYTRAHPRSGRAWYTLGMARLQLSQYEPSAQAFSRALELGYRKPATLYNLACVEARRGGLDRAFRYLDQSIDAGFDASGQIRSDDDLDNLRGDPRYREAIRKADARRRSSEPLD